MKNIRSKIVAAGLLIAGVASTPQLHAQITYVAISGGNASSAVVWQAFTNQFANATLLSAPSSTVHSYQGYLSSLPGTSPNVQVDFVLNGAVGGLQDITYQNTETNAVGSNAIPIAVISSTTPEAVGLSSSVFTEVKSLVAPYAFIKSPVAALTPGLTLVTNITQRQAYYLENSAGPNFHSAYIGGTNTTDSVYFVGRNTASAVRTETDANIYFTGTIATYATNSAGLPILDPAGGQTGGSAIRLLVNAITNAIGTVAVQDIKTNIALAYEGVPYSVTNVQNGLYPLWGYEHYFWLKGSGTGTPSTAQLSVLTNLLAGVTNATFQSTSPVFVGNFVPYSALNVQRSFDGGPITWTH